MSQRVLLLGATGTIGRAVLQALRARGHDVVAVRRPGSAEAQSAPGATARGVSWRASGFADAAAVSRNLLRGERFDAVVSCMASRHGAPDDAWAVDHLAHRHVLHAAGDAGVPRFVQLSAICVQKPRLAFQHAKLAFEHELMASGLAWTIVRPTAYFKSLSGQLARVQRGRPFLVFGDGRLTACKPIADEDLAGFLVDTLEDVGSAGRVLPIGGPGDAITPLDQAERLSVLLGRRVPIRHVPVGVIASIAKGLGAAARVCPPLQARAEFARIGHYYATESMLVWDEASQRYDAAATPATGQRTLWDHYAARLRGEVPDDRGAHAVY